MIAALYGDLLVSFVSVPAPSGAQFAERVSMCSVTADDRMKIIKPSEYTAPTGFFDQAITGYVEEKNLWESEDIELRLGTSHALILCSLLATSSHETRLLTLVRFISPSHDPHTTLSLTQPLPT